MKACIPVLMATFPIWFHGISHGHEGDRVFAIPKLSMDDLAVIDVHDGLIDDWLEVVGDPALTALDFEVHGSYDPSDFDFQVWLGWSRENHLYFALVLIDDDYVNEFTRGGNRKTSRNHFMEGWDGSILVFVDGDHSGGLMSLEGGEPLDTQAQFYEALGVTFDDGPPLQLYYAEVVKGGLSQDWFLVPPYADGGGARYGENPTVAVTEFYLTPFDEGSSGLATGDTAVFDVSWARIKASLAE